MIQKKKRESPTCCASAGHYGYIMQESQHMNGIIVCTLWTETQESILMLKNYTSNL